MIDIAVRKRSNNFRSLVVYLSIQYRRIQCDTYESFIKIVYIESSKMRNNGDEKY